MSRSEPPPFGSLLLRQRAAAGLTQAQLAARAGLSSDAIAALERGRRIAPRSATVALLADALGLDQQVRAQFVAAAGGTGATERSRASAGTAYSAGEAEGVTTRETERKLRRPSGWLTGQPTPLVDRSYELATIIRLLAVEGVRLLTLTGPAGVGKTRLALAAAAHLADVPGRFPAGVVLVDLTPVRDPAVVLSTIAQTLGLLDVGSRLPLERLVETLAERQQLLVVLDNFEQVLPAAAQLADLLANSPRLALLVTSRVPLQLRWEQTLRIAPLQVPDLREALPPLDVLLAVPSVELFVGRAQARRPDFVLTEKHAPLVAQLAVQLDGLPLALELAAARLDVLSLPTLARRLGDRLRLLTSAAPDRPERQRSLEAAVGWSYDLLPEAERRLFRCLGVFVGRVTLDAIATIVSMVGAAGTAAGDGEVRVPRAAREGGRTLHGLLSLAEKSLILPLPLLTTQPDEPGALQGPRGDGSAPTETEEPDEEDEDPEPAFGMLETVREYAWARLAAEHELTAASRAHAHYFLALAKRADPLLRGRDQQAWFFRLEHEQDNLRAALRWLLDSHDQDEPGGPEEHEAGLRLAGALGYFWLVRGYHVEGCYWLEAALARAPQGEGGDPAARTRALLFAGVFLTMQGKIARARAMLEEGLALAERRQHHADIAWAHTFLGLYAVFAGEMAEGTRQLGEALRRWEALDDSHSLGLIQFWLGLAADIAGDADAAAVRYADALVRLGAAGDAYLAVLAHCYLGVAEGRLGKLPSAVAHIQAAVRTGLTMRDRYRLNLAVQAAVVLVGARAEPAAQARLLGAADALTQAAGSTPVWLRVPAWQDVVRVREPLAREESEWAAAYREGRALPASEMATLALRLLEEVAQLLPLPDTAPTDALTPASPLQPPPGQRIGPSPLSAREQEVLRLVAQGLSSKAIGLQLFLAPSTVNYHLTAIFNKLGVDTRAQAVAVAAQRGLL